ncbi:acyl-CoA synthetase (AMP-forming)/AMP-acid ligase II [Streptomyces sp. B3I7]|uniref:AMP-binding protein n=1 Tax=Streptomyces sp. B3I7 TaxID=3042269 RepID=UPI002781FD11|nr:AMP-binding protein [Streptomyces sp. B3I7]MDQ0810405.1 acyl-CoA synthetase (AMP-forming)/AMP-acid ligase II [Streptomyces sp. B3I7]
MTLSVPGFAAHLADRPDDTALIRCRRGASRTTGRGELVRDCHRLARTLYDAGVRPGHKAVVMTRDAYDLTTLAYALGVLGAVPVLIEPRAEVGRCLEDVAPDVFIGEPLAHLGRRVLGWGRAHVRVPLVIGAAPGALGRRLEVHGDPSIPAPSPSSAAPLSLRAQDPDGDPLAMIAFTSGSTGRPKGAEYRHTTLAGQIDALRTLLDPRPDDVLLAGFLPVALLGPLLGPVTVAPAVNHLAPARTPPRELVGPVLQHRVTTILASPAVLALLAGHCARHRLTLPSVRRILSFGAPLRTGLADALRAAVPVDAEILSVYGATECLPVSALDDHTLRTSRLAPPAGHAGTCLGRPLPGVHARILDADATGLGEIAVAGPTVSPAYHARPDADAVAKSVTGHGVLHRTGDLGRLDDEGRLWFLGRKAHLVTGAGFTLPTEDLEAAADTASGVRRTALVGAGPAVCQLPVLCVESLPSVTRADALAAVRAVLADHPDGHRVGAVLPHRRFPVDPRHNSKIDRMRLAGWATRRLRGRFR